MITAILVVVIVILIRENKKLRDELHYVLSNREIIKRIRKEGKTK
ncbi:hypothetical protein uvFWCGRAMDCOMC455_01 [Freshwater phage uvFW-CGR-AMD-COM-C455]|nr:hypothetical protein uvFWCGRAMDCOMC455_01 [Freshwater phage uvFW-CGR-AMD-COM-C455]